jgi:hypothetical protein
MVSKSATSEVVPVIDWSKVTDLNEARALLGTVVDASAVLGDGSEFIKDKNLLVGTPFLILEWRFNTDEATDREYVNVLIMNANGDKARFNDGGSGVYEQLSRVTAEVGQVGIQVKNGLRRSDYTFTGSDGKPGKATTYYLSV